MENVCSAPWEPIANFWLRKVGYEARHTQVDSKDFMLPQTRQRGYLIAVDYTVFGASSPLITDFWAATMKSIRERPSAAIDDFLLEDDDDRLVRTRVEVEVKANSSTARGNDWEYSRDRHADVRRKELLPNGNPYTFAEFMGATLVSLQPHMRSWMGYIRASPGRIVDLLDIDFLRCRSAHREMGYKMLILDLSQNADFSSDIQRAVLGLSGCITPSAIPWRTDGHRLITGIESLSLQGIPRDELVLSNETNENLQNVAGNTMTTTVVGTGMLLALISVKKHAPAAFMSSQQAERPQLESPPPGLPFSVSYTSAERVADALDTHRVSFGPAAIRFTTTGRLDVRGGSRPCAAACAWTSLLLLPTVPRPAELREHVTPVPRLRRNGLRPVPGQPGAQLCTPRHLRPGPSVDVGRRGPSIAAGPYRGIPESHQHRPGGKGRDGKGDWGL